MTFFSNLLRIFKNPFIYVALILNFLIAWPIFSFTILLIKDSALKNLNENRLVSGWQFFINGYQQDIPLTLAVSVGTAILYTLLFNWLWSKKDKILERHYIRSVLSGSILSMINLFPIFLIYQFLLGETNFTRLVIFTLIGPFVSIGLVGPPAFIAGAIIGFLNGILAQIIIIKAGKQSSP